MKNYNYELHLFFPCSTYYYKFYDIFANIDKRLIAKNNIIEIVLFYKSIFDICKYLNICFEDAKKYFISGKIINYTLLKSKIKLQILPNEMNCLIDYIVDNEKEIKNKYGIVLDSCNNINDVEKFLCYGTGGIKNFLDSKIKDYVKLLNSKGIYDTYYYTNV